MKGKDEGMSVLSEEPAGNVTLHQDFLRELERIREDLVERLEDLDMLLEKAVDLPQRVSIGQVLWALNAELDRRLSVMKEQLRNEVSGTTRPGTIKIAGVSDEHHAALTVPCPKYVLRTGAQVEKLRAELGEDFDRLFQTRTTYTPNKKALEEEFQTASPERKRILFQSLDQRSSTVRISFRE